MAIAVEVDPDATETLRTLFREYAGSLGFDLGFQGFEDELASLPGGYAPPRGRIWLARVDGAAAACVAVRPMATPDRTCEMKRLWVRPEHRGHGLGRRLAEETLRFAAAAGYARMRLDTISTMVEALALYRSLGFEAIAPYYDNPLADVVYMERRLAG